MRKGVCRRRHSVKGAMHRCHVRDLLSVGLIVHKDSSQHLNGVQQTTPAVPSGSALTSGHQM